MVIQAGLLIEQKLPCLVKLIHDIAVILPLVKTVFIFHIKRLAHIKAVQPDLEGIDQLMPEVSCSQAGLVNQLGHQGIARLPVPLLSRLIIEKVEDFPCVNKIQIVFFTVIALYGSILFNIGTHHLNDKIQILTVSRQLVKTGGADK